MAKESKEILVQSSGVLMEMPDYMKDMGEDTRGNEGVTKDDLVIPRLSIIQALSPEIRKSEPEYIEGAEQGMLFNTLTRKLYTECDIIPLMFDKQYLLWKDRKKGGGFGGSFQSEQEAMEAINLLEDPDNWEVTDTPTHLCLVISDGKPFEIAIPMPKSKAKVSRSLNSMIRLFGGPRFARVYKIKPIEDKNKNNEVFWNFHIEFAGFPPEDLFHLAESIYTDISSGAKKYSVDDNYTEESEKQTDAF